MNREDYEILLNSMPAARDGKGPPDYAVRLLEDTCRATGLDWKRRHVYLMQRGGKWGVTLSIDGFRLIGSQHPEYAGQEGPLWVTSESGSWMDVPPEGRIYASKVGIRSKSGAVTWGVAKFADYKAGPMWDKFPSTMSAKCAEMLAWRKAFPGALGGLYGLEEMAQADKAAARVVESGGSTEAMETPALETGYATAIQSASTSDELKAIGAKISADSSIPVDTLHDLHRLYSERRTKLGG